MKTLRKFVPLFCLFFSLNSFAQAISISDQYVRETIPGTKISSAYMTIKNDSAAPMTLTGVTSNISNRIELHEHVMTEDMMKMQQVDSIIIKANDQAVLQPHGYHIMVFDLHKPLQAESDITLTLHFNNKENITIDVPVKGIKTKRHQH